MIVNIQPTPTQDDVTVGPGLELMLTADMRTSPTQLQQCMVVWLMQISLLAEWCPTGHLPARTLMRPRMAGDDDGFYSAVVLEKATRFREGVSSVSVCVTMLLIKRLRLGIW